MKADLSELQKGVVEGDLEKTVALAKELLEKGVDIRLVQILLGHSSIRSTEIYTHLSEPLRHDLRQLLGDLFAGLF